MYSRTNQWSVAEKYLGMKAFLFKKRLIIF